MKYLHKLLCFLNFHEKYWLESIYEKEFNGQRCEWCEWEKGTYNTPAYCACGLRWGHTGKHANK